MDNQWIHQRFSGVCVAYRVLVHETPHRCSHFTSEEDNQKEEELKKENKGKKIIYLNKNNNFLLDKREILTVPNRH